MGEGSESQEEKYRLIKLNKKTSTYGSLFMIILLPLCEIVLAFRAPLRGQTQGQFLPEQREMVQAPQGESAQPEAQVQQAPQGLDH